MFKAMKQGVSRTIKESEVAAYQKNEFTVFKDGKELPNQNEKELAKVNKELVKENKELKKQVADLTAALKAAESPEKPKE